MRVRYFEDTDTALIELGTDAPHETRALVEDVYVDLDAQGRVISITVEHASRQGDPTDFSYERIAHGSSPGQTR